ncbi:LysE family translocator [Oxalobacter sp. OxGP1]|uniref:LysE family translocator n=1 Tax=Oxalobacter paeniformigenes TaxID=2946594 RepID=UPI0022AFC7E8|nr:LysE family translocator [Oxalobacter paeniformigenes]MCZ4053757.1 LysE family translocator [Oxalobacter paeniformigenes]
MIPIDVLGTYFIACLILAIAPGPDNIFVLTQSALQGKKAGLLVVMGLCTGLLFHTTAVALGVAVIFKTSELAFTLLKLAGAGYLLYLAWGAFRSGATTIDGGHNVILTSGQLYRRGIFMNITNPKVSIFFLAFLPQFADPSRGLLALQMMELGFVFIVSAILVFGAIALAAGALGEWLNRSANIQRWINRLAGTIFVGLAIKLLLTER